MKLFINNKWRFLNLNYINKCDLITQQKNIFKSIYNLPKIHKIHVYLNTWEVQKYCEEAKNKTISPEDFQIGAISLLQTIANTNIKIKNYYLNTLSLKIPLDSFPDLREHNRINLNEMFFLTKIKLHIDIVIKQTNKKYQYKNIYPLWLNSINNN